MSEITGSESEVTGDPKTSESQPSRELTALEARIIAAHKNAREADLVEHGPHNYVEEESIRQYLRTSELLNQLSPEEEIVIEYCGDSSHEVSVGTLDAYRKVLTFAAGLIARTDIFRAAIPNEVERIAGHEGEHGAIIERVNQERPGTVAGPFYGVEFVRDRTSGIETMSPYTRFAGTFTAAEIRETLEAPTNVSPYDEGFLGIEYKRPQHES